MPETKTAKYVVTEQSEQKKSRKLLGLSLGDDLVKGSFFVQCNWIKPRTQPVPGIHDRVSHTHDCPEIIGFMGSNMDDWRNLGGEVEFWMDGEKHILTRTTLIYVPAGMKHCPMIIHRADKPIFLFNIGPSTVYARQNEITVDMTKPHTPTARTAKYFVTEQTEKQKARGSSGLTVIDETIKGTTFFWQGGWLKPRKEPPAGNAHGSESSHRHDCDEAVGFFGSDMDNWRDLGGEVEIWLDGEKHVLTKSFLIFVPKGMDHCPIVVRRVDRPLIHFTTGPAGSYIRLNETPFTRY